MPVAAANGVEISYTDSGGQGPAVVFSHGYLMDHTMFDRQVTALAPHASNVTHPDEVNQAILGFLGGLDGG